jgi:hypothetical protein
MITESELRTVLSEQARDVSEPDEILARLQLPEPRRRRSRRWLATAAAVAAVVVAATVATLVAVERRPAPVEHRPAPGTSTRPAPRPWTLPAPLGQQLRFTAALGPVPGYNTTTDGLILARSERFDVLYDPTRAHGQGAGTVTVYDPGAYDVRQVMQGQRVTLLGRPAYYTFTRDPLAPAPEPGGPAIPALPPQPTLAWQASDSRWIVIQGWREPLAKQLHLDPLTEERRIAAAVNTSVSEPIRLPFRIGYLPHGLTCVTTANSTTSPRLVGPPLWASLDLGCPGKPDVSIQFGAPWGVTYTKANLRVNGHPAVLFPGRLGAYPSDHPRLTIDLGKKHFLTLGGGYPNAELVKIAKSIVLASDIDHPSKWFDATK